MLPVTPSIIPEPFAEHGAKNVIPAESPGASEPNASWTQGFPPVTMLNRQAGGKPPLGQDFNGILNALSQHLFFTQSGCVYPWMGADETTGFPGLNYLGGSHVLGSDLKEYIAVHPSGPDVPQTGGGYVGPKDPVTDTQHLYWRPEVTSADIPEFDGVTIKEINGKYGVPEFTPPTASAPGKAGIVPGPGAVAPSQQATRPLCANGQFNTLTAGNFDVSWERANSTNIVLGAELVNSPASIASILYAGDFYANSWSDAPYSYQGEGVYSLREMREMGNATDTTRIQYSFFYALSSQKIYWRGGTSKRTAGNPMKWRDWMEVAGSVGGSSNPGTVFYFAGTSAPQGSLPCNGAAVSRTTYANLFAAIGTGAQETGVRHSIYRTLHIVYCVARTLACIL